MKNQNVEYDVSKEAFNHYAKMYAADKKVVSEFDLTKPMTYSEHIGRVRNEGYEERRNVYLKNDSSLISKVGPHTALSGDCLFNFNEKKRRVFAEYAGVSKDTLEKLEACAKNHHSLSNVSLLPATGGMNNLKGRLYCDSKGNVCLAETWNAGCHDRLDTFVYVLDKYYTEGDELILACSTQSNRDSLKELLDMLCSVYGFCAEFYSITNPEYVDKLVLNGNKPIEDEESLNKYLNLAVEYWERFRKIQE